MTMLIAVVLAGAAITVLALQWFYRAERQADVVRARRGGDGGPIIVDGGSHRSGGRHDGDNDRGSDGGSGGGSDGGGDGGGGGGD